MIRSWLFVCLMLALTVVTVLGFSPRYFWPVLTGQPLRPLLQHWGIPFHSVLNTAWLAFFVLQAWLVARGRTDLHRTLGLWFATYGVLLVVLDYGVGMTIESRRVALGETVDSVLPMTFAIVRDLVMFAGFFVAGIVYRRRPGLHRALMFLATYSLVVVGFGRFLGMLAPYVHRSMLFALFFSPIVVAAVYDWRRRGRPHPLYAVGFVVYLLFRSPVQAIWLPLLRDHWPPIGRALLQPFLQETTVTMMRTTITLAALATFSWSSPGLAQSETPEGVADRFAQAWSTHDRAAFDRLFTDDAHFIPTYDLVAEGRANVVAGIYQGHEEGKGPFRETTLTPSKVSVQRLDDDVAVVHFNVSIHLPPGMKMPPLERTLHLVVVRQPDGWRIASGQLTKPNCPPGGGSPG